MSGFVYFRRDRGLYVVRWSHKGKKYSIYKYKGEYLYHRKVADKLLAVMQADVESGFFRIEKYIADVPTNIIDYLNEWLVAVSPTLKPATIKDYSNSIANYLEPFFTRHPIQLHEIQYDVLMKLIQFIPRTGKGKLNVMYCLHACLDYAWRSGKIQAIPPFPKRKQYQIVEPQVVWLPEIRQNAVIEAISLKHQPIFWWLKYHYRRPGEACALHKVDFDGEVFTVHRTFSGRILTDTTKTGEVHHVPCHDDFRPHMATIPKTFSPFFFVNSDGKLKGQPYTLASMERVWNTACQQVGEHITMYAGLKHSSCGQFLNERGGTVSELQEVTDHRRLESVRRYGRMEVQRRKELMQRKVVPIVQGSGKVPGSM